MGAVVDDRYTYLTDDPQAGMTQHSPSAQELQRRADGLSGMRASSEGMVKLATLAAKLRQEARPGVCAYCGGEIDSARCSSCGAPRRR